MNGGRSSMRNNRDDIPEQLVVVGVPGTRRLRSFVDAAQRHGFESVEVVSYLDWIAGRCAAPAPGSLIRIESPSECLPTMRAILKSGIDPLSALGETAISAAEIDRLDCGRGEMIHPRQWYFGFREILLQLSAAWSGDGITWMSAPDTIIATFDKLVCLGHWSQAGFPVPRQIPGIISYAQLRAAIPANHARLFVKLRYGYSALGAVALEWRGTLVRAITTMEVSWTEGRPRLFLSKRPRVLNSEQEIEWLIDTLAQQDIIVEEWLPKARWKGLPFDLRVMVIGGRVQHVVGRANASPFTNLNLDAVRVSREEIEKLIGASWSEFETLCERAVAKVSGEGYLALDVLVRPGCQKFVLLEANAFGDFLPGLLHCGQSTYAAELEEGRCLRREALV